MARSIVHPPGPRGPFILSAPRARRDPFAFLTELVRDHGDIVFLKFAGRRVYLVNDPAIIKQVLVERADAFERGSVTPATERLVGGSIFLSEGAEHQRRKRAAMPLFGHERVEFVAEVAARLAHERAASWPRDEPFDMAPEISALGFRVAAANLFSLREGPQLRELEQAFHGAFLAFERVFHPLGRLLDHLPLPSTQRIEAASTELIRGVDRMVKERLDRPGEKGDLLDLLTELRWSDGGPERMTADELRAEAIDLLVASHATVSATGWTLYELAANPGEQEQLAAATSAALGGRLPGLKDLRALGLAHDAFLEGIRLHPPAWAFGRKAKVDIELGGWNVRAGSIVILSPYVTHRDPRNFSDPQAFQIARWKGEAASARQRFTYIPFGAGARSCLGEGIAMGQGTVTLATLVQTHEFRTVPGDPADHRAVGPQAVGRTPMIVHERRGVPA